MKRIILYSIINLWLACSFIYAQQNESRTMEREIKISGNYYYGDGAATTEDEAARLAVEELKMMISENAMEQDNNISMVDFKGFDENIGSITIPLEGRVRVIAFLLKKEVDLKVNGNRQLMVVRLSPDGPSLVATSNDSVATENIASENELSSGIDTASEANQKTDLPVEVSILKSSVEPIKSGSIEEEKVENQETNTNCLTISDIHPTVAQLIQLTESKEVGAYLNNHKSKGNLVYGRLTTLQNPELCYFVIIKDGKLTDVLDKTSDAIKIGLISGNSVDYRTVSDTIYWLYLTEN